MKLYRNIAIIAVIIGVLGVGAYLATNIVPDQNEISETIKTENSEMFNIFEVDSDDIVRLNIKNSKEQYYVEKNGDEWVLNGDKSIEISSTSVKTLVHTCSLVSVKKLISESENDALGFGFDENSSYAEIIFSDGSTEKILVGNKSLDNENYYVKLVSKPEIYLKNVYGTESLIPFMDTLRNLSLMSVDMSNFSTINKVEISKDGNLPICIMNIADESNEELQYVFKMVKPVNADISGEIFNDKIIKCISKLDADAVMEDNVKDKSVYGLNKPYASFSLVTENDTFNLKIGNETENYRFVMLNDEDTVYAVEKSKLAFVDVPYIDLMSTTIHVEYISEVDAVEVLCDGVKYDIKINGTDSNRTFMINDKKVEKESAVLAYRGLIGLSLDSVDLSNIPDVSSEGYIKYLKKDATISMVEFLPVSERNYRVLVNGKGNSITSKKNLKDAVSLIEKALESTK